MSLDQNASIPVDRHVFQFAERWYHFRSKRYEDIAEKFRALWGCLLYTSPSPRDS